MLIKKNFKNIIILFLFFATFISASFEIKSVASANNEYLTKKAIIIDGSDASNQGNASCSNSTTVVDQDPICKDKIRWVLEYKNDTGETLTQRIIKDDLETTTQNFVSGSVKLPNSSQYQVSYNGQTSTEPPATGVNSLQFNLNNIGTGSSAGSIRASIDQPIVDLESGYDPVIYYNQTLDKKIVCSINPDSPTYTFSGNAINLDNVTSYTSFDCKNLNDGSSSLTGRQLLSSSIGSVSMSGAKTDILIGHSPDVVVSPNGRYIYYAGIKVDLSDKNKSSLGIGCLDIEKFENCGFYSQVSNYQLSASIGNYAPISGLLNLGENFYYAETNTDTDTLTLHCLKGVTDSALDNNVTSNGALNDCGGNSSLVLGSPAMSAGGILSGLINIVGNINVSTGVASIAIGENDSSIDNNPSDFYCAKFDSGNGLSLCWGANNTNTYKKDVFQRVWSFVDRSYIIPHPTDPNLFCGRNPLDTFTTANGTSEELLCYSSNLPSNQNPTTYSSAINNTSLPTYSTIPTNLNMEDTRHFYTDPISGDILIYQSLGTLIDNITYPGIYCYNLTKSQTCANFGNTNNGYQNWNDVPVSERYAKKITFYNQCGYALGDYYHKVWSFDPLTGSYPCKNYNYQTTVNLMNQVCAGSGSTFGWDKITRLDNVPAGVTGVLVYVRDSNTNQLIPSVNGFTNPINMLNTATANLSAINSSTTGLTFEVVLEKTSTSIITDAINFNISTNGSLPQICFDTTVKPECTISQISNYASLFDSANTNTLPIKSSDTITLPIKKSASCGSTTGTTTTGTTTTSGTTSTTTTGTTGTTMTDLEITQVLLSASPVSPGSTIQIRYYIKNLSNKDSGKFNFTTSSIVQASSSSWTCSPVQENVSCGTPNSGNGAITMAVNNLKAGGVLTVLENVTLTPTFSDTSLLNTAAVLCSDTSCSDLNSINNTSVLNIPVSNSTGLVTTNSTTTPITTPTSTTTGTGSAGSTTSTASSTGGTANTSSLPATGFISKMPITSILLLLSMSLTIIFNAGFFSKLLTKQLQTY